MEKDRQTAFFDCGRCYECLARDICGGCEPDCLYCASVPRVGGTRRDVTTCYRDDLPGFIADVGGLHFEDIVAAPSNLPRFPPYIPQIGRVGRRLRLPSYPIYAVACDLVRSHLLNGRPLQNLRPHFGIPASSQVLLINFAKDAIVERIWTAQRNVVASIAASGLDAVIAPNYSVFWTEPRMEQLINMKRSLVNFEQLQAQGVSAIPHIYWRRQEDLQRWADWIRANPSVNVISVNLQTFKSLDEWNFVLQGLKWLVDALPPHILFILAGKASAERIARLKDTAPNFCLINKLPYVSAFKLHRLVYEHGAIRKFLQLDSSPSELFAENIQVFAQLVGTRPSSFLTKPLSPATPR